MRIRHTRFVVVMDQPPRPPEEAAQLAALCSKRPVPEELDGDRVNDEDKYHES
jgi:hypothetical protein